MNDAPRRLGAYGLHLPDLAGARDLLVPAPADWISWEVRIEVEEPAAIAAHAAEVPTITQHDARLNISGGHLRIDREAARTTLYLDHEPAPAHVLHPHFSLTAGVVALWRREVAVHASAVMATGGAWALVGPKGSGKSTTVAAWGDQGLGVLTDDVLVIRGGQALAGPRCIDLRTDAGHRFEGSEPQGVVGARDRWRLPAAPVAAAVPLLGFVSLAWGDEVELVPVEDRDARVRTLFRSLTIQVPPLDPTVLPTLVGLPHWELRRPRDPDRIGASVDALAERLGYERA